MDFFFELKKEKNEWNNKCDATVIFTDRIKLFELKCCKAQLSFIINIINKHLSSLI